MAEERKYRIRVDGILVDVSKEVYRAYEPDGMVIHKEPAIDKIAGSFYESRISQGRSSVLMGGLPYKEALA